MCTQKPTSDDPLINGYEQRVADSAALHESLVSLPMARLKKFDGGRALPLRGYSLVQWIRADAELWTKLTTLSRLLHQDFIREGIAGWFYFLPPDTFHATVRDICVGDPRSLENYIKAVRAASDKLAHSRNEPAKLLAEALSFMGQSSIAAMLHPANRESLLTLIDIRSIVEEELERREERYTKTPAADFFGHITIAYPTGELCPEVYRKAKELVRAQSQKAGSLGELTFNAVELRRFESMIDWSEPLETSFSNGRESCHFYPATNSGRTPMLRKQ